MNQGGGRRDKGPGHPHNKKRRPASEGNQSQRGNPYGEPPMQLPYQHAGVPTSSVKPFVYRPQRGYPPHHNFRNNNGPQFPGHQVFMQHRPFGNNSGPFRMGVFPHHFPPRVPPCLDPRQPAQFCRDFPRNGYGHHQNQQWGRPYSEGFDPLKSENGYHRNDRGARPKSGKYYNTKRYHRHEKKNCNNSSNIPNKSGASNNKASRDSTVNEHKNPSIRETAQNMHDSKDVSKTPLVCTVDNSDCLNPAFAETSSGDDAPLEGAVGGVRTSQAGNSRGVDSATALDKNLIDEGAICDLDGMFQNQEYSRVNGQCFEDFDDSESDFPPGHRENGVCSVSSDDEDSELDNCEYSFRTDHSAGETCKDLLSQSDLNTRPLRLSLCGRHEESPSALKNRGTSDGRHDWNGLVSHPEGAAERLRGNQENFEDGEDTGDFIDTDLPSHNKHLLSSSDEMENISSSSDREEDEGNEKFLDRKKAVSDFNCNDLSSIGNKVRNEFEDLVISESNPLKLYSSHSECSDTQDKLYSSVRDEHVLGASHNVGRLTLPSKSAKEDAFCSSSESENGDHLPLRMPELCPSNVTPHHCENAALDGAAASTLDVEGGRSRLSYDDPLPALCPPGAECELPLSSPSSQCFHSNVFCSFSNASYAKDKDSGNHGHHRRCREHAALTASSEVCPGVLHNHMANPDSGSPSMAAEGGACCPCPEPRVTGVNNLNACCPHSHSHVANGFSSDSPRANFSNDESNRHQKVFVKFPMDTKGEDGLESYSASSGEFEDLDGSSISGRKKDKSSDSSGGSEDPFCSDVGDNVDMVLLPMEEEIEPVHLGGLCAGSGDGDDPYAQHLSSTSGLTNARGVNLPHGHEDHSHLLPQDQNPLGSGMPSKEFYELIKTVSTTETCMRFFDKDGVDVQREPLASHDDDDKDSEASGGQGSKTERLKVDKVMIWNEYEAYVMQFKQIAVSACGQTAVLNVLKALNIPCEKAAVCQVIKTSLRKEEACIPQYLFSRACAGTTAEELMAGVEKLSQGEVGGRFFHFWPTRKVKLLQWLAYWMNRGAIPMATLNLQQGPHSLWQVPDSWHHQMVYGVSPQGLYLTNPLEIVSERSAMRQLCSDSVLMVRRQDVISRFRESTDLRQLLTHPDPRWRTMNVLGQVVNVLREFNLPSVPGYRLQVTSHVSIPASYKAGITLFMRKDKAAWPTLLSAPEIPQEQQ